ncbi:hypothetical protein [Oscillibacter sp. 1-3]|nr:hypothetical protein [Oscillibacter sp. 1-3]
MDNKEFFPAGKNAAGRVAFEKRGAFRKKTPFHSIEQGKNGVNY